MAASGTLIALPSWAEGWNSTNTATHVSSFSLEAQNTLAAVADTIIPTGDSIGAMSVGVDKFLQRLFDDCYEAEVRNNIRQQLQSLERSAEARHRKTFGACTQLEREELLNAFSQSTVPAENEFFKLVKSETIRGFTTSREVMVDFYKFKQVPGHYYGCVDVNA